MVYEHPDFVSVGNDLAVVINDPEVTLDSTEIRHTRHKTQMAHGLAGRPAISEGRLATSQGCHLWRLDDFARQLDAGVGDRDRWPECYY